MVPHENDVVDEKDVQVSGKAPKMLMVDIDAMAVTTETTALYMPINTCIFPVKAQQFAT